jgi:hypothetical protein
MPHDFYTEKAQRAAPGGAPFSRRKFAGGLRFFLNWI